MYTCIYIPCRVCNRVAKWLPLAPQCSANPYPFDYLAASPMPPMPIQYVAPLPTSSIVPNWRAILTSPCILVVAALLIVACNACFATCAARFAWKMLPLLLTCLHLWVSIAATIAAIASTIRMPHCCCCCHSTWPRHAHIRHGPNRHDFAWWHRTCSNRDHCQTGAIAILVHIGNCY